MALAPNLTINDVNNVARTFSSLVTEPQGVIRKDTSSTVVEPRRMTIRHTKTKKATVTSDRHLLQFSLEKVDASGAVLPLVLSLSCSAPRSTVITTTMYYDLVALMLNWLAVQANKDAFWNGES